LAATEARSDKLALWRLKDLSVQTEFHQLSDLENKSDGLLDLMESNWRDAEEMEDVEVSKGVEPTVTIPILYGETPVVGMQGAKIYNSTVVDLAIADNFAIYLVQSKTGVAYAQLLGHTSDIEEVSSTPDVSHLLVSASR
jgi:hypothetical protein